MSVGSHRTHQSKLIQGFQRPPTSTHQTMIPPHGRTPPKTIMDWSPSKPSRASRVFFQPRLLELVTQPTTYTGFQSVCPTKASRTSNSTRQGLRVCPTRASRTSNSTQAIIGLPKRLFNQGFQSVRSNRASKTSNLTQAMEK